ncbi:hypothetical protein C8J57DRAFT_1501721 [Mycena rebaudengoi]|nr:hypothetical protein C8J57DRAFT_1501721 [Mycena rebaudengoi]
MHLHSGGPPKRPNPKSSALDTSHHALCSTRVVRRTPRPGSCCSSRPTPTQRAPLSVVSDACCIVANNQPGTLRVLGCDVDLNAGDAGELYAGSAGDPNAGGAVDLPAPNTRTLLPPGHYTTSPLDPKIPNLPLLPRLDASHPCVPALSLRIHERRRTSPKLHIAHVQPSRQERIRALHRDGRHEPPRIWFRARNRNGCVVTLHLDSLYH